MGERRLESDPTLWTADQINLSTDITHWNERLTKEQKRFLEDMLASMKNSNTHILEETARKIIMYAPFNEARSFYAAQKKREENHSKMYSVLLSTLTRRYGAEQKMLLQTSLSDLQPRNERVEWLSQWVDPKRSFNERLLAFVCLKGILSSGSFCSIYWFHSKGLMPGLCYSNALISREEAFDCNFACQLFVHLNTGSNTVSAERVMEIVAGAIEIETKFFVETLPSGLPGLNLNLMSQYIRFVAEFWLNKLGYSLLHATQNPFRFMM
jgi:ribonucleotide reductase beta subunit family protein with ferritin-like domain